jgi:hypothetical protein
MQAHASSPSFPVEPISCEAVMTERQALSENNHPFSVPPVFANSDSSGTGGAELPQRNADKGSSALKRLDETTSSGDALNDTGEDNQRSKSRRD